jgi:Family of unknown function (DUF5317)
MPASPRALEQSGRAAASGFANSAPLTHAHLTFLGDIIATPRWLPFANVFSIGDITLVIGRAWLTLSISKVPDHEQRSYIRASTHRPTPLETLLAPDPKPKALQP